MWPISYYSPYSQPYGTYHLPQAHPSQFSQIPGYTAQIAPGSTYIYPQSCTLFLMKDHFDPKSDTNNPICQALTMPLCLSVNEFVKQIGGGKDGWVMTEYYENGGSSWRKGLEVKCGKDGEKTLMACGFARQSPIWVRVWKS